MAHTKSRNRIAHEMLAHPIGALRGGLLTLVCRCCNRQRVISVNDLCARFGLHHRLLAVVERLRCDAGGQGPASVRLSDTTGEIVPLIGPGAY